MRIKVCLIKTLLLFLITAFAASCGDSNLSFEDQYDITNEIEPISPTFTQTGYLINPTIMPTVDPISSTVRGGTIYFLATFDSGKHGLYRYDCLVSEIEMVFELPIPGIDGAVSSDGKSIILTLREDISHYSNLFILSLEDNSLKQISFNDSEYSGPQWSPIGSDILVGVHTRTTGFDIYRIQPDGWGMEEVVVRPGNQKYPTFSPDGSRFAFVSDEYGSYDLFIHNEDNTIVRLTENSTSENRPAWSPDGKSILFESNTMEDINIYRYSLDDHSISQLGDDIPVDPQIVNTQGVWSPDGEYVAYISTRNGILQLFAVRKDSSNPEMLTHDLSVYRILGWIP